MAMFNGTPDQIEKNTNKITEISEEPTDEKYYSAKAVNDGFIPRVPSAVEDNIATFDANGNIQDGGIFMGGVVQKMTQETVEDELMMWQNGGAQNSGIPASSIGTEDDEPSSTGNLFQRVLYALSALGTKISGFSWLNFTEEISDSDELLIKQPDQEAPKKINFGMFFTILKNRLSVFFSSIFATKSELATIEAIAKGATQAKGFGNYEELITHLLPLDGTVYKVGQPFYIIRDVPDLWCFFVDENFNDYEYTTDETIIEALKNVGVLPVGHYILSKLDTEKVDLTNYQKSTNTLDDTTDTDLDNTYSYFPTYNFSSGLHFKISWNNIVQKIASIFAKTEENLDADYIGHDNDRFGFAKWFTGGTLTRYYTTWGNFKASIKSVFDAIYQPKQPVLNIIETIVVGYTQLTSGNFASGTTYAIRSSITDVWVDMVAGVGYTDGASIATWLTNNPGKMVASYSSTPATTISRPVPQCKSMLIRVTSQPINPVTWVTFSPKYNSTNLAGSTILTPNHITDIRYFMIRVKQEDGRWLTTSSAGSPSQIAYAAMQAVPYTIMSVSTADNPYITGYDIFSSGIAAKTVITVEGG